MTLHEALSETCSAIGIAVPRNVVPGKWVNSPVIGKSAANTSGRVLVFDDRRGGIAYNWATGQKAHFGINGADAQPVSAASRRDVEAKQRREREENEQAAGIARHIVRTAKPAKHPYLTAKGFPEELGLVHEFPQVAFPDNRLGEAMKRAMPEGEGPWLIVPGRIGKGITTVQFIGTDGAKKNLLRGRIGGAAHRIATGAETWVCEGIATALTIRAALRLLGRSATVLSAFSASNVASIVSALDGAVMATDNDKPIEAFGGMGTGEFYARKSGRTWAMPPEAGDWNDHHQASGLRAVAMLLREVRG